MTSRVLSGNRKVLDGEAFATHLRDRSGAGWVAEAFAVGVGVGGNDLRGYRTDVSVGHRSVVAVSAVAALSPEDVLVSDRSSVAHADSVAAGASAGDSVE